MTGRSSDHVRFFHFTLACHKHKVHTIQQGAEGVRCNAGKADRAGTALDSQRNQQRGQADTQAGSHADALAQATAFRDHIACDRALGGARRAHVDGGRVDWGMVVVVMLRVHGFSWMCVWSHVGMSHRRAKC